jgi:hypothetical protein
MDRFASAIDPAARERVDTDVVMAGQFVSPPHQGQGRAIVGSQEALFVQ